MQPEKLAGWLYSERAEQLHRLQEWDRYYRGEQALSYMHPELLKELEGQIRQVVINWPQLVVDALEERLDVEGFRLDGEIDQRLWGWWQANKLDNESEQAHVDALALGRSYAIVGYNEDDPETPLITVESPLQVFAHHDPRTRRVTSAIKVWRDDYETEHITLYLPNETVYLGPGNDDHYDWVADPDTSFVHNLGVVPVVPIINRPRTMTKLGTSELAAITPLSDAACKIATDMMVSANFHALPRLVASGVTDDDFRDQAGRPISKWSRIAGRIWASKALPNEMEVKQLPEADMRNFHDTLNALARLVGSLAGMPPHYFGWSDANPASADAIRSSETRLVKRAERRQRSFGESWEDVMRIALLMVDGELPLNAARLETVWRDPATPTAAQTADALMKLSAGLGIPPRALWSRVPGATQQEVLRWEQIADREQLASARAQATAFGVNFDPDVNDES